MKKLFAIPVIVVGLLAGSSAIAEADFSPYVVETSICGLLDTMPTDYGVQKVVAAGAEGVSRGNYTTERFAQMMVEAVTYYCPDYYGLVMRSADRHSTGSTDTYGPAEY